MNFILNLVLIAVFSLSFGCAQKRSKRALPDKTQNADIFEQPVNGMDARENEVPTTFTNEVTAPGASDQLDSNDDIVGLPPGNIAPVPSGGARNVPINSGQPGNKLIFLLSDGRSVNIDWDGKQDSLSDIKILAK
jgi:hypothetical protein